jgi:transposase InsO family protein
VTHTWLSLRFGESIWADQLNIAPGVLELAGSSRCIQIGMDGKGRWCDNVFVERFWRSTKYEEIYLHAHETVSEARSRIGQYTEFINNRRPYSRLKRRIRYTSTDRRNNWRHNAQIKQAVEMPAGGV